MKISEIDSLLIERECVSMELIEILQDIQEKYNYLPEKALKYIAKKVGIPEIEVFRVANYYKAFTLQPRGKHLITVCSGTACHVRGAPRLVDELLGELQIAPGETTKDRVFTVETVNCLGACALGPIIVMDGEYYDHMNGTKLRALIKKVRKKEIPVAG